MARQSRKTHSTSKNRNTPRSLNPPAIDAGHGVRKSSRFAAARKRILKKVDRFSERTLAASLREREGYASRLLEIDSRAKKIIESLQARGSSRLTCQLRGGAHQSGTFSQGERAIPTADALRQR